MRGLPRGRIVRSIMSMRGLPRGRIVRSIMSMRGLPRGRIVRSIMSMRVMAGARRGVSGRRGRHDAAPCRPASRAAAGAGDDVCSGVKVRVEQRRGVVAPAGD
eukprot:gene4915-29465_t